MNHPVLKSSVLTPAGRKIAEAVCLDRAGFEAQHAKLNVSIERLFNLLGKMQEQLEAETKTDDDDDRDHPSLTAAERNPSMK
jgi:hypothetical protein